MAIPGTKQYENFTQKIGMHGEPGSMKIMPHQKVYGKSDESRSLTVRKKIINCFKMSFPTLKNLC